MALAMGLFTGCYLGPGDRGGVMVDGWEGEGEMWAPELQYEGRGVDHISGTEVWWDGGEIVSPNGEWIAVDTGAGTCDFDIDLGYMTIDTYFDANDTEPEDHDGNGGVIVSTARRVILGDVGEYEGQEQNVVLPGTVLDARYMSGDFVATWRAGDECGLRWHDGTDRPLGSSFCAGGELVVDNANDVVWIPSADGVMRVDRFATTVFPVTADEVAWDATNGVLYAIDGNTLTAYTPTEYSLDTQWTKSFDNTVRDFGGSSAGFAAVLLSTPDGSEVFALDGANGDELASMTTWQTLNRLHVAADATTFAVRGIGAVHMFRVVE